MLVILRRLPEPKFQRWFVRDLDFSKRTPFTLPNPISRLAGLVRQSCSSKKIRYPSLLDENPYLRFLADGGYMVEKMAKLLFEDGIEMESWGEPEKAFAEAAEIIGTRDNVVIFETTVIHGRYSARIDVLAK